MSTPAGGSGLRTGGFVLLGLAVVLLVAGLFSLRADDGRSSAAATTTAPTASTAPATPTTAPATTLTTPAPTTPAATTPVPPPTTNAAPVDPRSTTSVVVLNNSTVTGLASRAAAAVRADGWTVREVGNLSGRTPTTTVYYPDGQAGAARALAAGVGVGASGVQPRPDGLPGPDQAMVLVVTSDFRG